MSFVLGKTVLLRKPCLENFDGHPPCVNWLGKFFDGSSWIVASSWWICTVLVVYSYIIFIIYIINILIYNIYIYIQYIYTHTIYIYIYIHIEYDKASSPEMMTSRFSEKSPPTKHSKNGALRRMLFLTEATEARGCSYHLGMDWPISGDLGDGWWLGLPHVFHDMVKKDVQNTTVFFGPFRECSRSFGPQGHKADVDTL